MSNPHEYPPAIDVRLDDGSLLHIEQPRKVTLAIDLVGRIWVDGVRAAYLTKIEARVLRAIMTNASVTTFDFLLSYVYGGRDEPETKILTVFVHKIRRKLGEHAGAIETVWGRGWVRGPGYRILPESLSTIDIPIDIDQVDRLMLHTGLPAEDCVGLAIRETVDRLENQ